MLVLALVLLSLQLMSNPNVVSANSAHVAPEANSPSIPNYQWQFLSPSEKAAVDASMDVILSQRIRNVTLNVVDASGAPYNGPIRITQEFTQFDYSIGWTQSWSDYVSMTPSRAVDIWAPWNLVEETRGTFDFSNPDRDYWAVIHAMNVFHLRLFGPIIRDPSFGCCSILPDWAKTLDHTSLLVALREYVAALVTHFKGRIQQYEIWDEANVYFGNGDLPIQRIIDIIKIEALTIRSIDPDAKICIDLINLTSSSLEWENQAGRSNWTTEDFVQRLLAAEVPFDVIGLETHYGSGPIDFAGGVDTLYHRLIELGKFGKPIYVWEDGLESYIEPNYQSQMQGNWWVGPWHGTPSEQKQAEYMVAETLVYLGNPSVSGVKWLMLLDVPDWPVFFIKHDGVVRADGTEKQSFYALKDLWGNLTINTTIESTNGVATFRGLAGNYSISVEGYEAEPSVVHVSEGKTNTSSLVLRSFALRDQASQTLSEVGSNLTATSGGVSFQSSEAKNLFNQSLDEYHTAEQVFQSKDYAAALQHAQKALDLIHQAYSKEREYVQEQRQQQEQQQRQQLLTRTVENVVVVAVVGGCTVAAVSYLGRRKRAFPKHHPS